MCYNKGMHDKVMNKRNVEVLRLASRFSLPPNSLGYCGKGSAPEKLKTCALSGKCFGVEEELSHFIVLYPYLKTISKIIDKPIFSYPVVESYWLGNDALKKADCSHFDLLLENFSNQGVPENVLADFRKRRLKEFIPHHFFHVLYLGVGKASKSVAFNIDSINKCMIRWGRVEEFKKDKILVSVNFLEEKVFSYKLVVRQETFKIYPDFVSGLAIGDFVAIHWDQVVKILTSREEKNLSFWTNRILDIGN